MQQPARLVLRICVERADSTKKMAKRKKDEEYCTFQQQWTEEFAFVGRAGSAVCAMITFNPWNGWIHMSHTATAAWVLLYWPCLALCTHAKGPSCTWEISRRLTVTCNRWKPKRLHEAELHHVSTRIQSHQQNRTVPEVALLIVRSTFLINK